jgi:hypothetical protein
MNTLNMPGFTANASLYPCRARYQLHAMLAGSRHAREIVPSRMRMGCDFSGVGGDAFCCNAFVGGFT